jgi:DNA repair protein RadC
MEKLTIKSWALDDRPREKLVAKGKTALSNAELIAILIGSGNREESAVALSKRILKKVNGNINELAKLSVEKLTAFKGIGAAKAISIITALELGKRRQLEVALEKPKITSSKDVANLIRLVFKRALELASVGIIVCHNHPSGKLQPSNADKQLTQKIKEAGSTLDIKLLDHLIITEKEYFSFADENLL